MKLPQTIQSKYTTRKFNKLYKYKAVVRFRHSQVFRNNNLQRADDFLAKMTNQDGALGREMLELFRSFTNYRLRVESPWLGFYTDNPNDFVKLVNKLERSIHYVQYPEPGTEDMLDKGLLIKRRINHKWRVNIGRTKQDHTTFLEWADKTGAKVSSYARHELLRTKGSWGGFYIYLKDDKSLTMARMMLGDSISSIEEIVKH